MSKDFLLNGPSFKGFLKYLLKASGSPQIPVKSGEKLIDLLGPPALWPKIAPKMAKNKRAGLFMIVCLYLLMCFCCPLLKS